MKVTIKKNKMIIKPPRMIKLSVFKKINKIMEPTIKKINLNNETINSIEIHFNTKDSIFPDLTNISDLNYFILECNKFVRNVRHQDHVTCLFKNNSHFLCLLEQMILNQDENIQNIKFNYFFYLSEVIKKKS